MIKNSVFKRNTGADGEEESSRSTVTKTLAPRPAVIPAPLESQQFFKSVAAKRLQAQKRQIGGKTERKTEARGGNTRGSLAKGFLRPESSQNARQAGSWACHVCNQHFVTIPQDLRHRQEWRQIYMQQGRLGNRERKKTDADVPLLTVWCF